MAINFPTSPTTSDIYTESDRSWKFNGTSWDGLPQPTLPQNAVVQKDEVSDAETADLARVDKVIITNRNNAPFVRASPALAATYPALAQFQNSGQDWVLDIDNEVHVEWLGAKGDCAKVTYSVDLPSFGTDDSTAFLQARQLCQLLTKDSYFTGDAGMVTLTMSPKRYYVKGDNPLGTTFRRTGATQNLTLAYGIRGNGALIYWEVDNATDTCIASYETMTWQQYEDFSVFPCGITAGTVGVPNFVGNFYTNTPDETTPYGANTLSNHRFQNVQCILNFEVADRPYTGLNKMFHYTGTVKGEGLSIHNCKFSGYLTGYHCNNSEAVHHSMRDTFWASYADNTIHFLIEKFGSGFVVDGGGVLMKGDNQTLLHSWRTSPTGNGSLNTFITINNLRLETVVDDKNLRMVYANAGFIEFTNMTGMISGTPDPDSIQFYTEASAFLRVRNAIVYGRVATGFRRATVGTTTNYGITLDGCVFNYDPSEQIGFYDGDLLDVNGVSNTDASATFTKSSTASSGTVTAENFAMVLVENTVNEKIYWSNATPVPTLDYTFLNDFVYNYNSKSGSSIPKYTAKLWDTRGSVGYSYPYLNTDASLGVLPAGALVTSIKLSAITQTDFERVKVYVGTVLVATTDITASTRNEEMLLSSLVYINGTIAEREVTVKLSKTDGTPFAFAGRGTIQIEYQPMSGILESNGVSAITKTIPTN